MSAEIIPFGKPQKSASVRRRRNIRKVRAAGEETVGNMLPAAYAEGRAPTRSELMEVVAVARRYEAPRITETVRFMFDGWLYEAGFCGDKIEDVKSVHYRITAGGVQELKSHAWHNGRYSRFDITPAMAEAARSARGSDQKDADIPFREAALAAFHKRRAKLISEVEKIDATLASMQCN
jgi:hypothetical protein